MWGYLKQLNASRKVQQLLPFIKGKQRVLDLGCGDLSLATHLHQVNSQLTITGVDIVDFATKHPSVQFTKYDGQKLPFKKSAFDTVIVFHVLHHCDKPLEILKEAVRVANKRIILIEPVYRHILEIPIMRLVDWGYNVWKERSIAMNYKFSTLEYWLETFKELKLRLKQQIDLDKYPVWTPIGRSYLFELTK